MGKKEIKFIALTLGVIIFITLLNLRVSFMRSRDAQRIGDIQTMVNALVAFQKDNSFFPPSKDGKIVACGSQLEPVPCEWGEPFIDSYLRNLPRDPHFGKGVSYRYVSNGGRFQLYAALEGSDEAEFSKAIFDKNFSCGTRICNFGRAYANTALDKTIEEYENEINSMKEK